MYSIKEKCHECKCTSLINDSIFRIFPKKTHFVETSNQWFIGSDILDGNSKIENKGEKDIWTYCKNCYVKYTMKQSKYKCLNCVQNKKPLHLDQDGKICMICLQNFIVNGLLIPESEYYSKNLSLLQPKQSIPKHDYTKKLYMEEICIFCKSKNLFNTHNYNDNKVNSSNIWYKLINSGEMSDGYNTIYKVKPNNKETITDNLKYPASVCDVCIDLFSLEDIKSISCDLCLNTFVDSDCGGGINCAAFVGDNGVFCGYGSDHDMERYRWMTGGKPDIFRNAKNICDKCLVHLINQKLLIPDGEYNFC